MPDGKEVTDAEVWEMYCISRSMGGQPREEALIEVADNLHIDQYDVMDHIDAYREAKGLKPIDWE